jgi:lysophospholipid acyltransferase (LPLAT)-like uncharacterized protein
MSHRHPRKSGIVIPNRLRWHQRLAIDAASALVWLLMKTWRCRWQNSDNLQPLPGPVIFCLWHNRLSLAIASYDDFVRAKWPSTGMSALISASKDGAFLTAFVEKFGVKVVRGSSSRRGPQALLEATSWMEKKYNITITPDGPRGPCYKVQPGIIHLAHVTGAPIIPISNHIHKKITVNSWDRFQIPLPFSRCDLRFGAPLYIAREATDADLERARQQLEKAMQDLTTD